MDSIMFRKKNIVAFTALPEKTATHLHAIYLNNSNKSFRIVHAENCKILHLYEGYFELFEEDNIILNIICKIDPYNSHVFNYSGLDCSPFSKTTSGLTKIHDRNVTIIYRIREEDLEHFEDNKVSVSSKSITFDISPFFFVEMAETPITFYTNFTYSIISDPKLLYEKKCRRDFAQIIDSGLYDENPMINSLFQLYQRNISDNILTKFNQNKPQFFTDKDIILLSIDHCTIILGRISPKKNQLCSYLHSIIAVDKVNLLYLSVNPIPTFINQCDKREFLLSKPGALEHIVFENRCTVKELNNFVDMMFFFINSCEF